jgi:hypothetical protein
MVSHPRRVFAVPESPEKRDCFFHLLKPRKWIISYAISAEKSLRRDLVFRRRKKDDKDSLVDVVSFYFQILHWLYEPLGSSYTHFTVGYFYFPVSSIAPSPSKFFLRFWLSDEHCYFIRRKKGENYNFCIIGLCVHKNSLGM